MKAPRLALDERQNRTDEPDGYGKKLKAYFEGLFREYEVTDVSVVVLGQRYTKPPEGKPEPWVEIVYAITVDSKFAIPHALEGKSRTGPKGNRFSFSQLANSVYTSSYSTAVTARYIGSDPPTEPPG
jgi:hypothetical protein